MFRTFAFEPTGKGTFSSVNTPTAPASNLQPRHDVVVNVCTYNERENLPRLIETIFSYLPETDILVVDDESPDGTGQLAEEIASRDPRVKVKIRRNERGLGTATLFGFKTAMEAGYSYIINLDADFSHHPRHLPDLLAPVKSGEADVAVGSRYISGGGVKGWPMKRHIMSHGINVWTRFWMGLKTRDCSGSYRCYRADTLRKIDFSRFRAKGYAVQEELLFRASRAGARFQEVPIMFEDRVVGESKINMKEAINAVGVIARCGMER